MADQLLKSVRITDDMKVEVYQQGKKRKYAIFYDSNNSDINRRRSDTENTKSEKYDVAMSDDEVIEMALKAYNGKFGTPAKKYYITQKTYIDPAPVRTYGNGEQSPYYLNNGCSLNIRWVGQIPNPDFVLGTFSNIDDAEDATGIKSYLRDVTVTSTIDDATDTSKMPSASWGTSFVSRKEVTVNLPKGFTENGGKGYLVWTVNGLQYNNKALPTGTSGGDSISNFSNHIKDSDIIELVISYFETDVSSLHGVAVSSIGLKLCAPNNEACSLISYKSPLEPPTVVNDLQTPVAATQSTSKIKLTIDGLDDEITLKAKTDIPAFTIWAGDIPKTEQVDQFDDLSELDDEYSESGFAGEEEKIAEITQLNSIDDEPAGPSFDESLSGEVDKSAIGRGPVLGSKLTNKSGSSMINLAGHRLTPILKDLENYLNKNGYPGTKIGNNGVMRPLRDSAYPSSPARAAASLHGAGLAIDVTFKIPGFKWSGIGDNKNLAANANLTRVINNFVKGQGDITWGASWGKGSKPADGVVLARGVTEYHHFEIRADLIPKYWEPVKDELAKFGFKPTDLKSPGRGGNLHKLMLKLLGDTA
jgi:hypothetical protein